MSTAGELSGAKRGSQADVVNYREARIYRRDHYDWYVEPAWSVDALVIAEGPRLSEWVWDPACGGGNIVETVRRHGLRATGSDLIERGFGDQGDFLAMVPWMPEPPPRAVVCNPPYGLAEDFARRALGLVPYVALLVQAKFLYSGRRHKLFTNDAPARVYHLSDRPSMPPGDLLRDGKIKATGGKMDFCWVVWSRDHAGPTTAHWIRKPGR